MRTRRFPLPWSVEELDACFVVRDHNGQQLAYVYFEDERGDDRRRSCSARMKQDALRSISPSCRNCCSVAMRRCRRSALIFCRSGR
jgi:hypothetical protein